MTVYMSYGLLAVVQITVQTAFSYTGMKANGQRISLLPTFRGTWNSRSVK